MSEKINKEIEHDVAMNKSMGQKTRELLKEKNIVSPNTSGKIKIANGFWVARPKGLKDSEIDKFILQKRDKYKKQIKYL